MAAPVIDVPVEVADDYPSNSSLSEWFVKGVPVDGASISVVAFTGNHSVVSTSGSLAMAIERVQFDLGEGPHWEVLATGRPVLIDDVAAADGSRWPTFFDAVAHLRVGSMFSFPLSLGGAMVGVVDLVRHGTGVLTTQEVSSAVAISHAVTLASVLEAVQSAQSPDRETRSPEMRREIHQATGMIAAQLGTTTVNALAVLRAYTFSADRPMLDIAKDIIDRRIDLADPR